MGMKDKPYERLPSCIGDYTLEIWRMDIQNDGLKVSFKRGRFGCQCSISGR